MTIVIEPEPTWWQRQRKRMSSWWMRWRVRMACWILRIDGFNIKMQGTIRSWETNIPRFNLTLDGDVNLMDGGVFTHNEGCVTFDTLDIGSSVEPGESLTIIGEIPIIGGGTLTCTHCGASWKAEEEPQHALDCPVSAGGRVCNTCKHRSTWSWREPCWTCLDDFAEDPWPRKMWEPWSPIVREDDEEKRT